MASFGLFASGAYAGATIESVQAFLNHTISVKVNNKTINMTDSDGNPVTPIVYNGTAYFPIRTISTALGASVKWDQNTNTIIIDSNSDPQTRIVTEDQVIDYLISEVPEIKIYGEMLATSKTKLIIRVEGKDVLKNGDNAQFYQVYVGEDQGSHTVRWQTFFVKENLTDIKVYEIISDSYISLDQWKKEITDVN